MIVFSEEYLAKQNVAWLSTMNHQFGLTVYKGDRRKKKQELIDQLLEFEASKDKAEYLRLKNECEEKAGMNREGKNEYIETVPMGTLVAFAHDDVVDSAKLIGRNESKRTMQLLTIDDKLYEIKYENILWVKTGTRWPKGIYNLLKQRRK